MASPHVAGTVALLLQSKGWTSNNRQQAEAVRGLLQNTAVPAPNSAGSSLIAPAHRQGAGMVKIDKAIQAPVSVVPGKLAQGEAGAPLTHTLTLTNSTGSAITYDAAHQGAVSTFGNTFTPSLTLSGASAGGAITFNPATVIVPAGGEAAFLAPLPLERLWGVGPKTREVLHGFGIRTIGELASLDPATLDASLGAHGQAISERARGIDEGEVVPWETPKSIGHEHTFDVNTLDRGAIVVTVRCPAERCLASATGALAIPGRTRPLLLRATPRQVASGQRVRLRLPMGPRTRRIARRALLRRSSLRATITVRVSDGAGNRTAHKRTVLVTRHPR